MGCTFRARFNALGSIWYTILVLALHTYLLYLGLERYRLYTEMKWPSDYSRMWLSAYLGLYAVCIPAALLFFAFGCFKSGNISGDGERLGDREERVIEIAKNRHGTKRGCLHGLKSIWQHSPPLPQLLHVLMALCQLIAQQLMLAQLFRHSFINSGDFLNTELDFVYHRRRQLTTNLPMGDSRLQGFRITAEELTGSPIAANVLPLLMNFRLFGIPLEFVNFVIALLAYSIAYPNVFWRVSKSFSLWFSLHMFIYAATMVYSYIGFSILYRIQETNFPSTRPVGLGQYLAHLKWLPLYHPYSILGCYVASTVLITLAPIVVYTNGYNRYFVQVVRLQAKNSARAGSSTAGSQMGQSDYGRYSRGSNGGLCCEGYAPHVNAILLLLLIVAAKGPILYALMVLWQYEGKWLLLSCIIVDCVYLFTWIVYWLMITLKREWYFNVSHRVHQIVALQGLISGSAHANDNPSELKSALIVMHKDNLFVTDDPTAKQSLLRQMQKSSFGTDEMYWLKANGQQSPTTRKIPMDDGMKNTPDMGARMAGTIRRRSNEDESPAAYHSISRPMASGHGIQAPPQMQAQRIVTTTTTKYRADSSPPDSHSNTFGTLQRNQQSAYASTLTRSSAGPTTSSGTLQRSLQLNNPQPADYKWPTQQEAYASIHKSQGAQLPQSILVGGQRRGSNGGRDDGLYSNLGNNYSSNYGTYSRLPPQGRVAVPPGAPLPNTVRMNTGNYPGQPSTPTQRRSVETNGGTTAVRQSPQLSAAGDEPLSARMASREQSPYQRSGVKLSSFNSEKSSSPYGSVPTQWNSSNASKQPLLWNGGSQNNNSSNYATSASVNKTTSISTSSSQQDAACFTPTSTLTSQGSNYTPTPGSPSGPGYNSRFYEEKPRQVATGVTSIRHTVKVLGQDSYSDPPNAPNPDFATSIV